MLIFFIFSALEKTLPILGMSMTQSLSTIFTPSIKYIRDSAEQKKRIRILCFSSPIVIDEI